jgi:molybdate transport system substrate-binding protein
LNSVIEPTTRQIHLLSGGAAQGLVGQLQERFLGDRGCAVSGTFGAVGAMRDKLTGGEPCDVVILTQALIDQLIADGRVVAGSEVPLGVVKTGIAVKAGEALPDVRTPQSLRAAFLAATGIYFPDPVKATAGIHFMKVLKMLGIDEQVAPRLHPFPNGATAMRAMSQAPGGWLIGCTQVTEILYTPGVQLVGPLPHEFELATVYTAAVCSEASQPEEATAFIRLLSGTDTSALRLAVGFEAL